MIYALLRREWRVYGARIPYLILADGLFRALLFGLVFGYLLPAIGMVQYTGTRGVSYVGTMIFSLFPMVSGMCQELLVDYETDRHSDYLIAQSSVAAVYWVKILFCTTMLWVLSTVYLAASKFILGNWLDTHAVSISKLLIMLGACAYAVTTLTLMCYARMTRIIQVRILWRRILVPLTFLSGYLVPWSVVNEVSPMLSYVMYANPMVYILEGLRAALFQQPNAPLLFFPVWLCAPVLVCMGSIFGLIGGHLWRRKLDAL